MLDKRTTFLLQTINELCTQGSYKVVDATDLKSGFPEHFCVDEDGLKAMLNYLQEHEYIDIRYYDKALYCLCVLPEGRLYAEREAESKRQTLRQYRGFLWIAFAGAFVGSVLGATLVAIVSGLL